MTLDSNLSLKASGNGSIYAHPSPQKRSSAVDALPDTTQYPNIENADVLTHQNRTNRSGMLEQALRRAIPNVERLFVDPDDAAALWLACEHEDIHQARTLITGGADASWLLLRKVSLYPQSSTESHGKALNSLICAGADVDTALAYAIAENHSMTHTHEVEHRQVEIVQALLVLGADGTTQLNRAITNHDQRAARLLLHAGVSAEPLLIDRAMHDDAESVAALHTAALSTTIQLDWAMHDHADAMVIHPARPSATTSAVIKLAKQGHQRAVELLIASGVDTSPALLQLLERADSQTVKLLIASGAPTKKLMAYLSGNHALIHHNGITLLSRLISAGVDPSAMLCVAATTPQDLARAEILILAGATVSSALKHASSDDMENIRKTLFLSWAKVSLIKTQVQQANRTESADIEIVEKILFALTYAVQPETNGTTSAMKGTAIALMSKGEYEVADLLLALEAADWAHIKKLSMHVGAASKALQHAAISEHQPALRLLKAAGALMIDAVEYAMMTSDLNILHNLIRAGWSPHRVLTLVVTSGNTELANQLIHELNADKLQILHGVFTDFGIAMLQHFIPAVTDGSRELFTACSSGDIDFARILITAGANANEALVLAVSESNSRAIAPLLSLGAKTSDAAAQALATDYSHASQLLFALG